MALIRSFRDVPPGGWRYIQPETAVVFTSDNFDDLVRQIRPHREYKHLPTDTIELDVQRQLCLQLSPTECKAEAGEDYNPIADQTRSLTTAKAVSFTKAVVGVLAEIAAGRSALCDRAEAATRADTCRRCPFNRSVALCSCSAVYKAVEASIPKDRRFPDIGVCAACGCSLQAKVNLPLSVVTDTNSPGVVFPTWCWQRPAPPLNGANNSDTSS
jgi:hypothetical protein